MVGVRQEENNAQAFAASPASFSRVVPLFPSSSPCPLSLHRLLRSRPPSLSPSSSPLSTAVTLPIVLSDLPLSVAIVFSDLPSPALSEIPLPLSHSICSHRLLPSPHRLLRLYVAIEHRDKKSEAPAGVFPTALQTPETAATPCDRTRCSLPIVFSSPEQSHTTNPSNGLSISAKPASAPRSHPTEVY
ncbi:hypothetical protein ACLOJK_035433 [Asimina triloba]